MNWTGVRATDEADDVIYLCDSKMRRIGFPFDSKPKVNYDYIF